MSTPSTLVAGRYRLVKLLGAGGMGVVWHAWDERLERPVALKMLRTQPELSDSERDVATNRAMREARITAGLHHPHAVTVHDVVEHEGRPCIVMQLLESTPLSILLSEHGTLTPNETARIGAQVASALAAAHKMRIVHRDVKPGNILITQDGSAMISDFGISHALGDATITATGLIHGTPAYLAPEVARGRPSSFASDVFSLGSTLYAMLEGDPPFGADKNAIALLHKVARGGYPSPKHAGVLAPLLRDMLSPDPKRRPGMTAIAASLTEVKGVDPPVTLTAQGDTTARGGARLDATTVALDVVDEPASPAETPAGAAAIAGAPLAETTAPAAGNDSPIVAAAAAAAAEPLAGAPLTVSAAPAAANDSPIGTVAGRVAAEPLGGSAAPTAAGDSPAAAPSDARAAQPAPLVEGVDHEAPAAETDAGPGVALKAPTAETDVLGPGVALKAPTGATGVLGPGVALNAPTGATDVVAPGGAREHPTAETDVLGPGVALTAPTAATDVLGPGVAVEAPTAETTAGHGNALAGASTVQSPARKTVPMDQPTRFEPPTAETEPVVARADASAAATLVIPRHPPIPASPGTSSSPPGRPPIRARPGTPSSPRRRRRTGAVVGVVLLVGALVVGALFLFNPFRMDAGTSAAPAASSASEPSSTPTPQASTTAPAPVVSSPPPPPVVVEPPPLTPEERVVQTITGYYASVPGDLEAAWPTMTADYQQNHAGGRNSYNAFWSAIAAVEVSDVSASAPDQAQATLTYYYNNGRVVQEVTAYRLVDEGGVLKVAASDVLSSVDL